MRFARLSIQFGLLHRLQLPEVAQEQYIKSPKRAWALIGPEFVRPHRPRRFRDLSFHPREELCRHHADLVDDDPAKNLAMMKHLADVASSHSAALVVRIDARPMVDSLSSNAGGHTVLKGQAHELGPVRPLQYVFEQFTDPSDDGALPCARQSVHKLEQRLLNRNNNTLGAGQNTWNYSLHRVRQARE